MLIPRSLDPQSRKVFWAVGGLLLVAGALGVGSLFLLPVLFTRSRRGPHDLLADTVVIRTP